MKRLRSPRARVWFEEDGDLGESFSLGEGNERKGEFANAKDFIVWDFCKGIGILVEGKGFLAICGGEVSPHLDTWPVEGRRES